MNYISTSQLEKAIATAVNRAALASFKLTNNAIKQETGITRIPIYSNTRFRRATTSNPTAMLSIRSTKYVPISEFQPYQQFRRVGLGRQMQYKDGFVDSIADAFITYKMRGFTSKKPMVYQRYGKGRKIRKPITVSLSDFYNDARQNMLSDNFQKIIQKKLNEEMARVRI